MASASISEQISNLDPNIMNELGTKMLGGKLGELLKRKNLTIEDLSRMSPHQLLEGVPRKEARKVAGELKKFMPKTQEKGVEITTTRAVKNRTWTLEAFNTIKTRMTNPQHVTFVTDDKGVEISIDVYYDGAIKSSNKAASKYLNVKCGGPVYITCSIDPTFDEKFITSRSGDDYRIETPEVVETPEPNTS